MAMSSGFLLRHYGDEGGVPVLLPDGRRGAVVGYCISEALTYVCRSVAVKGKPRRDEPVFEIALDRSGVEGSWEWWPARDLRRATR